MGKFRFNVDGHNYTIYTDNKTRVIAVSTYAGKSVRGIATCASGDEFDLSAGVKIAANRCAVRIAEKRLRNATNRYETTKMWFEEASKCIGEAAEYKSDAVEKLAAAQKKLEKTIKSI